MVWPLERECLLAFAQDLRHILVIEEKDGIIEAQIKDLLYNRDQRPSVCGKQDLDGEALIPAAPLAGWLRRTSGLALGVDMAGFTRAQPLSNKADGMRRRLYFCSSCPHNTSTRVPEDSQARQAWAATIMAA